MPTRRRSFRRVASFTLLAGLCLDMWPTAPARAADLDLTHLVPQTLNGLNPIAIGVHSLLSDAISEANQDLEARLRQLESIINSAIFSLQTALNYGIDKLDWSMQQQLRVLNASAQQLVARYGVLARATLREAQTYLQDDLDHLQSALGNTIAQIDFLNTTPIVNISKSGFAIFRSSTLTTELLINGVGLAKNGVHPTVTLVRPRDGRKVPVPVVASSMPMLMLSLTNESIRESGRYVLSAVLCSGTRMWLFNRYVVQEFPLLVCDLPHYQVTTKLWMEGAAWENRTRSLAQGNLVNGTIYGVQCPAGNGNARLSVTAQADPGWELYDPGWGRLINCVENSAGGYHDMGYEGPTTCWLYADGRSGNAHLNVVAQVAERRRVTKTECAPPIVDRRELRGTAKSTFEFNPATLQGGCDGSLVLKSQVTSSEGDSLADLTGFLANGEVAVSVGERMVSLESLPKCKERTYGEVVVLPAPR